MSKITYQVVEVCDGNLHACADFEGEELDEALLSDDADTRAREVKALSDAIASFDGTYEEAYDLFTAWIDKIEAGV